MKYFQEDLLELGDVTQQKDFIYDVVIEADIHIVDYGIGHYEFWGAPGYDSQMGPEIQQMDITYVIAWDEEGNETQLKFKELDQELQDLLESKVDWTAAEEYFCENYEEDYY